MNLDKYIESGMLARKETMTEILDEFGEELTTEMLEASAAPNIPFHSVDEYSGFLICLGGYHALKLLKIAIENGQKEEEELPT